MPSLHVAVDGDTSLLGRELVCQSWRERGVKHGVVRVSSRRSWTGVLQRSVIP